MVPICLDSLYLPVTVKQTLVPWKYVDGRADISETLERSDLVCIHQIYPQRVYP